MFIQKIGVIGKTYRQIERYSEILGVLFKFGFDDVVNSLKVDQYLDMGRHLFFRERKEKIEKYSRAQRLRMVLEELGPTFIKLGQVLSTRADVVPQDFLEELIKLQDEVPSFPFDEVKQILETELSGPFYELFVHVEPEPVAAASMAQVHRARLFDGQEVVIKVQRPGIRRTVEVDLEIMFHIATLMERHLEGMELHRPTEVVEEFGRIIERELDFKIEAGNMERFASLYRNDPRVYIPKVIAEASTERVLTMEFIDGIKAGDLESLRVQGYDLAEIADLGGDLVMQQTMVFGYFHADPHPGNLMVLPGPVMCLLDLGMVGRLDRRTREEIVDLVLAVTRRDAKSMVSALLRMTEWEEEPDRRDFERDVADFVDQNLRGPLKDLVLGRVLQQIFEIASHYRLRVPADLLFLIKALTVTEGLGRQLNPDFDIVAKARPFVKQVQMERYSPGRLAGDLKDYTAEWLDIARDLPADIRTIVRLVRTGKIRLQLDHGGFESLRHTLDQTNNRLSYALVLAALIIASSIIVHSGLPPTWHEIPIIGLVGYIVAGAMGLWLLITILRRGMM